MIRRRTQNNLKINHWTTRHRFNFRNIKQNMKKPIKTYSPEILNILSIIGITSKGCANTYKRFFNEDNIISEIQTKWSAKLNEGISTDYSEIALQNIRKLPISAYTKYSLFKLLHSYIATNKNHLI